MYLALVIVGGIGYLLLALMGALHGHGDSAGHAHAEGHAHALDHAHSHLPHAHGHGHGTGAHGHDVAAHEAAAFKYLGPLMLLSPLNVFAFMVGMGATGFFLQRAALDSSLVAIIGILGGVIFTFGIVRPLTATMLRFASSPAENLEGTVARPATATTKFDSDGKGVVRLVMDGQVVQLLAHLDPAEHHRGVRVEKGDQVVVLEVEPGRNACRVTRELAL